MDVYLSTAQHERIVAMWTRGQVWAWARPCRSRSTWIGRTSSSQGEAGRALAVATFPRHERETVETDGAIPRFGRQHAEPVGAGHRHGHGRGVRQPERRIRERLPQYQSPKGFLAHQNPRVRHSDPSCGSRRLNCFWAIWLGRFGPWVRAGVSGAGQQHGSVYLTRSFDQVGAWSTDRRCAIRCNRCSAAAPHPSGWTAPPARSARR